MYDYENNIFIFTNETKNGKEESNIYQGYNQFLSELLRRTGCSLFHVFDFRKKINRFLKVLNHLVSIEKDKLLNAYYQTKLDYYNSLKLNLNSFKKHGYRTFITKPNTFEILFIKGSASNEIIEEIFNTPKLKVEFLMLLHIEKMEIDIEERKIDEDNQINMPDAVWKELFIWSDKKKIQQVQTIEQALEQGKAGYYIAGYETEHCNGDKPISICGTGKTVKEVCEDLMEDFLFCPDKSCETAQQLKDFLQYIGFGFEFCLLPASEELVMLYESARFYELYNTGNHINMMMDTNTYVECFFDGKLAQPYFIK